MPHLPYQPRPRPKAPEPTPSTLAPLASQEPRSGIPDTTDITDLPGVPPHHNKPPVPRQGPANDATKKASVSLGLPKLSMAKHLVSPDTVVRGLGLRPSR